MDCRCQTEEDGCQSLSSPSPVQCSRSAFLRLSAAVSHSVSFCPLLTHITLPLSSLLKLHLHVFFPRLLAVAVIHTSQSSSYSEKTTHQSVFFIPKGQIQSILPKWTATQYITGA